MSLLYARIRREAQAWHTPPGEDFDHPVVHHVRKAGYSGYVNMSPDRLADYGHEESEPEWDEDLSDETWPDPSPSERDHYEEHGSYGDAHRDRHDQAYMEALDKRKQDEIPDHEDDALLDFVGEHGTNAGHWEKHGSYGPVDIKSRPVYATQSHVSQKHLDKYTRNPSARTHRDTGTGYLGDDAPMMVTHQGRLHVTEGHHRVAAALQRGDSHIDAFHYDADKHGGFPDSEGHMPGHPDYDSDYGDADWRDEDER